MRRGCLGGGRSIVTEPSARFSIIIYYYTNIRAMVQAAKGIHAHLFHSRMRRPLNTWKGKKASRMSKREKLTRAFCRYLVKEIKADRKSVV